MVVVHNILLLFSVIAISASTIALECIKEDPCLCQINENDKIDISLVVQDVKIVEDTKDNVTYTYSGCRDSDITFYNGTNNITLTGVLFRSFFENVNVTVDKKNITLITRKNVTVLATANQTKFSTDTDDNKYTVTFVNGTDVKKTQPTIILLCDDFKSTFLKIVDDPSQKLLLSSPNVCVKTERHDGMSGGTVFLLIIFIIASIYFIGGAVLLYFIRGARGAEMIPNVEFWKNLPGLCKDGVIFLLSGCKPNFVTTAETYDRI